jgi:hypothetical protein
VKVAAFTLSYPPRRFIGSELMTHQLLRALLERGHEVTVHAVQAGEHWQHDGVSVVGAGELLDADLVVAHAGISWPGVEHRARTGAPLVMICHNASDAAADDLAGARPDLVVVNSHSMLRAFGVPALVINPPAPALRGRAHGPHVTALSLNELKGGAQFWELAERMPDVPFLAVRGGYGEQLAGTAPNVTGLAHVAHDELDELVWSRTAVFLQLAQSESWGMAASEAIARGIPVVAHPTPGVVESLGDAALYVDRDDQVGLEAAVRAILANRDLHAELAHQRARAHVRSSARQVAEWVTVIERLGHGDSAAPRVHRGR